MCNVYTYNTAALCNVKLESFARIKQKKNITRGAMDGLCIFLHVQQSTFAIK